VNQTPDLLRAVRLLVENGSRVNENGGRAKGFGSSLHILCETNQTSHLLSVARYLVESGSIVNLRDDKNNTVLHLLSRYNQTDHLLPVIRFLVEAGFTDVDIKAKNDQGQTALHVLCQYNQSNQLSNIIEFLIEQGVQTSETVNNSLSALSLVCKYNQTDQLPTAMKLLIPLEDVNQTDYCGSQAAHLCAQYQKEYIIKSLDILADNGADLASTNSDGETILHLACQFADKLDLFSFVSSLDKELIRKMMDLTDVVGRTPLHLAAKSGCTKTAQFLAGFAGVRILDTFGRCFADYLKYFLLEKGTLLCICCRGGSYLNIAPLYQNYFFRSTVQSISAPFSIAKIEGSIPIQIDHVYVFNAIDKYTKTPASNRWENLLRIWNNPKKKLNFETNV
jgi:ankyrin repeat protein